VTARVAVVGGGRMGKVHVRALAALGVRADVVDADPAVRDHFDAAGHRTMATVAELLDTPPDAAIVAAPTAIHGELCHELLDGGVPTLCEKPAGIGAATTRGLAEASARTGTALEVGYWRRFVPALAALRTSIASGAFGEVSLIVSSQWDHRPPPATFITDSGGIAIDMGVHEFDQVRWLTAQEFTSCAWRSGEIDRDPTGDDPEHGALVATLSGGSVAVVTLGRSHPVGDMCKVEVIGPTHTVIETFLRPEDGDVAFVDGVARQAAAFIAHVRDGAAWPGASIADAVAALEVAESVAALIAVGGGA
jgi:myo-inositol 2-dehydrogenase / D-chiro-inositol 1-dehydrogenase